MRHLIRLLVLAAFTWVAGFAWFMVTLPREKPDNFRPTGAENAGRTGIVALTGGPDRIIKAMELLENDQGARLLISGVNPNTTKDMIAQRFTADFAKFECCVDLGLMARSTTDNAVETKDWVMEQGYTRLILVTSDYHIRRSRAELRAQLPDAAILIFPVASEVAERGKWYMSPESWRDLSKEYSKYVIVKARLLVGLKP